MAGLNREAAIYNYLSEMRSFSVDTAPRSFLASGEAAFCKYTNSAEHFILFTSLGIHWLRGDERTFVPYDEIRHAAIPVIDEHPRDWKKRLSDPSNLVVRLDLYSDPPIDIPFLNGEMSTDVLALFSLFQKIAFFNNKHRETRLTE